MLVTRMSYGLPAPGETIAGKYTVERQLGQGGMGAVFSVTHAITGKRLALKCLLPEHASNADIVERFLREAQAAGRIQHRHVVDVFDVGREGPLLYIVMEYLEGKALADLLSDSSLLLTDALTIIIRSMEGVAAAHAQGIIHRDLKPDNIFVCVGPSGALDDPRVLDFGISKLNEDGVNGKLTKTGATMGTPYYMSLEQMSGVKDLDGRVDVYAMGVILYEAIAGEPPHVAESMSALAIQVLTTEAKHLKNLRSDLPPGLADVVMKAIAKQRDQRYPDMRSLIAALQPFVGQGSAASVQGGRGQPLRTPRNLDIASDHTVPHAATPIMVPAAPAAAPPAAASQEAWVGSRSSAGSTPEPLRPPSRSPVLISAVIGAIALAAAAGLWFAKGSGSVVEPPAAAAAPPPAPAVPSAPAATPEVVPPEAQLPVAQEKPEPVAQPNEQPEPVVEAPAQDGPAKPGRKPRGKRDPAAHATPEAAPSPTPEPTKEKTGVVKGRAGQIAPDDF